MKKTIIILATIASLSSCKKSLNKETTAQQVYYIRVQEVDNDGTQTETRPAIIKINQ
jgi:hypothetical protein